MQVRLPDPGWGFVATFRRVDRLFWLPIFVMCAFSVPAAAQPKHKADKADKGVVKADPSEPTDTPKDPAPMKKGAGPAKSSSPKTYDFTSLDLNGRMRTPQLLYFLERANEELERAFLEKRSFIPHMVRSVDEEAL
jgi:hypothetical protein